MKITIFATEAWSKTFENSDIVISVYKPLDVSNGLAPLTVGRRNHSTK